MEPFNNIISSKDELYEIYRNPSETVTTKESSIIDQGCEDFIKQSTFLLVGTSNLNGELDVSPRGGPAGFVKVIDNHRLVIPDLNGNNRLDSIQNIVEQGNVGLLFIIPGLGETLRINGQAYITKEEQILELFSEELRTPKTAIGVVVETALETGCGFWMQLLLPITYLTIIVGLSFKAGQNMNMIASNPYNFLRL